MSKIKICLDAGHYGQYNRSPVVKEYYEAEMAWKLHLLLKKHLELYGFEVSQTRSSQAKDMELTARGKASRGCDLFLSLHSNAASAENVNYVVGLYQVDDNCGDMDEQSQTLAKKLADCVGQVMGAEAKAWSTKSSSDRDGNGYKDDYYGVLRGAHSVGVAGVIIEHGFHTNKAQAEWLLNDGNLEKLAKAEAAVIADHYGYYGTENSNQKGLVEVKVSVLKKGTKGTQVKALQTLLIGYGYSCGSYGADGSFGGATDKAVRAYQKDNGLTVDGSVGPKTWAMLMGV